MTPPRGENQAASPAPWSLQWTPGKRTVKDWMAVLRRLPLFSGLGQRQLRRIAGLAEMVDFSPGDVIVQYGEPGDAMYVILDGRARVLGRQRARILHAGDFVGEMALLDGGPRTATVTAATEVTAMRLPRRAFLKMLESEPKIAIAMLSELTARLRQLQQRVLD